MVILHERGLSGLVKLMLEGVFLGGIAILVSLPFSLKWYFDIIFRKNGENYNFLLGFLIVTGILCLIVVFEMRKIFKTLGRRNPFMMDNVKSLKRMAFASFAITACYLTKIVFYNSFLTIIIAMVFLIAGLFSIILSEVFYQAVMVKEENDLTI